MSASLVEDTGFVWRKTWLFLVRERSLIVEEELFINFRFINFRIKARVWKVSKIRGNTGSFLSQIPRFNLNATEARVTRW